MVENESDCGSRYVKTCDVAGSVGLVSCPYIPNSIIFLNIIVDPISIRVCIYGAAREKGTMYDDRDYW